MAEFPISSLNLKFLHAPASARRTRSSHLRRCCRMSVDELPRGGRSSTPSPASIPSIKQVRSDLRRQTRDPRALPLAGSVGKTQRPSDLQPRRTLNAAAPRHCSRSSLTAGHAVGSHHLRAPIADPPECPATSARNLHSVTPPCRTRSSQHSNLFIPRSRGTPCRRSSHRPSNSASNQSSGSVTSYNWDLPPAAQIERKSVAAGLRSSNMILLHDGGHKQSDAVRRPV